MPATAPFETLTAEYDAWFETNRDAYRAELAALEQVLSKDTPYVTSETDPAGPATLEVGVGTGRFADPLEIPVGIDPARNPLLEARDRGVDPVRGVAERLPLCDDAFDRILFVTVWCFLDDIEDTLSETRRVLAADGELVIAFLDRSSPLGQVYQENKDESPFYADAQFVTGEEVCGALENAEFVVRERVQTVFDESVEEPTETELHGETERVRDGHGDGLFGVVRATLE
ncbi:class I SAM-dependent methyltransferase [Halostagnicola bangensis]